MVLSACLGGGDLAEDAKPAKKPRIIATTDGCNGDKNSMVRLLMCANEFDIEGLVYSSSKHRSGPKFGTTWIEHCIDRYAQVFENLTRHDPEDPTPEYLRSVTKIGNMGLLHLARITV